VLVDHLVAASKEAGIADAVLRGPGAPDALVVGHPYVDIWQTVKPQRLGLAGWPKVRRDTARPRLISDSEDSPRVLHLVTCNTSLQRSQPVPS
jgi:DUF3097, C-terminal domain